MELKLAIEGSARGLINTWGQGDSAVMLSQFSSRV